MNTIITKAQQQTALKKEKSLPAKRRCRKFCEEV